MKEQYLVNDMVLQFKIGIRVENSSFPVHMIRNRTSEKISPAEFRTHDRCVSV
jgi:hypothetical protein